MAGAIDRVVFDPYDWEQQEDPYPIFRRLRTEAPIYHNEERGFWALSRDRDVRAAVVDTGRYCSGLGVALGAEEKGSTIISMDPPRHTQLRALVSRAFTPRQVAALEQPVRDLCRDLLDDLAAEAESGDGAPVNLTTSFTNIVPMAVITRMLDVPPADRDSFQRWIDAYLFREAGTETMNDAARDAGAEAIAHLTDLIAERRRVPGDDLVSVLIEAEEDGDRLTANELLRFCFLLLIAGYETTTKLLGTAVYWLDRYPDQRAALLADPGLIPSAVEEVLRFDGPTPLMARTLTEEVTVDGVTMPEGARVLLLFGSANRDDERWGDPDRFEVRRNPTGHLAFGQGAHFCLGASIARLEGRIALGEFLARFPDYAVVREGLQRAHTDNNRGFNAVPVRLKA
jgi:hypothetical protein